ncbi:MAG: hypothetical protein EAZ61_04360 [Oscillatoriales cyanobacterium]|nr:MAG: hypothetical protein EAZ61_04360 [Oscillatoriales cyanobacterium]
MGTMRAVNVTMDDRNRETEQSRRSRDKSVYVAALSMGMDRQQVMGYGVPPKLLWNVAILRIS